MIAVQTLTIAFGLTATTNESVELGTENLVCG